MKALYEGLKAVYGPRDAGSVPIRSRDGNAVISGRADILSRWAEHFSGVLNQVSAFDQTVMSELPEWETNEDLVRPLSENEVQHAINQLKLGKAAGADGLPGELFKIGSQDLTCILVKLFDDIWQKRSVPQEFKDALIVHICKRKGDRSVCDNHRGISLLSIPGKILACVILNRLAKHVADCDILPESQCGCRRGRGTMDMIITARQLQEQCREQQCDLCIVFVDLTKAFNSVNTDALWMILKKIGCPSNFVDIIRLFHDGKRACVIEAGEMSQLLHVMNGTNQGCVLASLLFSIFFATMLLVAFGL